MVNPVYKHLSTQQFQNCWVKFVKVKKKKTKKILAAKSNNKVEKKKKKRKEDFLKE